LHGKWKEILFIILTITLTILVTLLPTYYSLAGSISDQKNTLQQLTSSLNLINDQTLQAQSQLLTLQLSLTNTILLVNALQSALNITPYLLLQTQVVETYIDNVALSQDFQSSVGNLLNKTFNNTISAYLINTYDQTFFPTSVVANVFDLPIYFSGFNTQNNNLIISILGLYSIHFQMSMYIPLVSFTFILGVSLVNCDDLIASTSNVLGRKQYEQVAWKTNQYVTFSTDILAMFKPNDSLSFCTYQNNPSNLAFTTLTGLNDNYVTILKL